MKVLRLNDLFPVIDGPPITRPLARLIHSYYSILHDFTPLSEIEDAGGFSQHDVLAFSSHDFLEVARNSNWFAEVLL